MKIYILNTENLNGQLLAFKDREEAIRTFNDFLTYEIMYDLKQGYINQAQAMGRWHKYRNTGKYPMFFQEPIEHCEMLMEIVETNLF